MDPSTPLITGYEEHSIETPLQRISFGSMIETGDIKPEVVVDIASMLLLHGASTEPINDSVSALMWAINSDNETLFKMLIAYGAKPSTWDLLSWLQVINKILGRFTILRCFSLRGRCQSLQINSK